MFSSEGIIKYMKENKRVSLVAVLAMCLTIFELYTSSIGIVTGYVQAAVFWGFIGSIIVITNPIKAKGGIIIDILLIALTIYMSVYQIQLQERLIFNAGVFSRLDIIVSVTALIVALVIGVRIQGWVLPLMGVGCIVYAFFGAHLPGYFNTMNFGFERIATYLFSMTDGLYGQTLLVCAQIVFLYVFFGNVLSMTGAGNFFVDIAFSIAGRARGGPAQAAIYSSMLMGTISGSGPANVVTTGTFTIPLMKKVGYKPAMAAAIESVASSGGQIMPPVMGAAAFLMSEMTGIPYSKVAIAAAVPAILYYLTLSASVYITARKSHMEKPDPSTLPKFWKTLKNGWFYLIPLVVIVYMIFTQHSAQRSAVYAIVASLAIGFIFDRKKMSLPKLIEASQNTVMNLSMIASACMLAGIIMGVMNLAGLGIKISLIIDAIAGGSLMVTLIMAMLVSLFLGMGLPTSASYILLAVLVAPAIVRMGPSVMATHLFILYFGTLSSITPPVALSVFASCSIAGGGLWETGWLAMKLAAAGFIVPFIFIYNNELILMGEPLAIAIAIISAILGCIVLAIGLNGWFIYNLSLPTRILLVPAAIMIIVADPLWLNLVGMSLTAVILFLDVMYKKSKEKKAGVKTA